MSWVRRQYCASGNWCCGDKDQYQVGDHCGGPMEGFPLGDATTEDTIEEASSPCTLPSPVTLAGKGSRGIGSTGRDIRSLAAWIASSVEGA